MHAVSPRALIAAGTGRYADPWHPFVATSHRIAAILEESGWAVAVTEDVDGALDALDGVDLLVVNAGDPWRNGETGRGAPEASTAGLDAALDRGIGVLAVHNAVSSLRDYPRWRALVGGDWVPEVSGHPPIGTARVLVRAEAHPLVRQLDGLDEDGAFELHDERYSDLVVDEDVLPLAEHVQERDGSRHPLLWAREVGAARLVYLALGHDERSYDSPVHAELIRRAARWTTRTTS